MQKRLGFAATFPQDVSSVPGRVHERCDLTKGPSAADLKFLHRKRQLDQEFEIEKNLKFTSALCFPKFVQGC
jgi:hypothetical protein